MTTTWESAASRSASPVRFDLDGGRLMYYPDFLSSDLADELMIRLSDDVEWRQPVITLFGKRHLSPRLASWYGDSGAYYTYSGQVNKPLSWRKDLLEVKNSIEKKIEESFNSVLLNLYRDGKDSMGWHSDDETELGKKPVIASISLGATRRFLMKHKRKKQTRSFCLDLENGSLLAMLGATQHNWRHSIPKTSKPVSPRINLTFRKIVG